MRAAAMLEAVLERSAGLDTLEAGTAKPGRRGLISAIARDLDMPVSTAHRQVSTLVASGFLHPVGRGRHVAGPRLRRLATMSDVRQIVASAAIGPLNRLAARTRSVAQLGSLEDMMVTYRMKTGHGAAELFTRVGMQLEAYCSGIGKVLLAHLPLEEQSAYLADGPFPKLTENTIVEPQQLARELARVRACGYAIDDEEIAAGLRCFAVPVRSGSDAVVAAISLSTSPSNRIIRSLGDEELIRLVQEAASRIEEAAFGAL